MEIREVITSQYFAALAMMKKAVSLCPSEMWDSSEDRQRFWHVAYHGLFYTHLYLQPREEDFTPWEHHRDETPFLGPLPWPPHKEPDTGEPYTKAEMLEYIELCEGEARKQSAALDLDAPSGFQWIPFGKLELQFYNIRHLQHHTGQLTDRIRARADQGVTWVGHVKSD